MWFPCLMCLSSLFLYTTSPRPSLYCHHYQTSDKDSFYFSTSMKTYKLINFLTKDVVICGDTYVLPTQLTVLELSSIVCIVLETLHLKECRAICIMIIIRWQVLMVPVAHYVHDIVYMYIVYMYIIYQTKDHQCPSLTFWVC